MLQYSALCDHDFIGWDVYLSVFNFSQDECQECAEKIVALNLAEYAPKNRGLTFHTLTQENVLAFVRKFPKICLKPDELVYQLLRSLNDLLDTNPNKSHVYILHAIKILQDPSLLSGKDDGDTDREKSDLCFKVGVYYTRVGVDYEKAIRMFRTSYELRCKIFRGDHLSQVDRYDS